MLQPYNITMPVYAESQEEADALQDALKAFVIAKYNQHIYTRAKALTALVTRHGNNLLVNNFIQ